MMTQKEQRFEDRTSKVLFTLAYCIEQISSEAFFLHIITAETGLKEVG